MSALEVRDASPSNEASRMSHHRSTALRSASLIGSEASSASVMGFTGGRRR
jgi:hypothetical protein